jgi:nicotinamidase-related amidase
MEQNQDFLEYLDGWLAGLRGLPLAEATERPLGTALVSVDVINGFCHEGPLASPRVRAILPTIVRLFQAAWDRGVRHILLTQDTHDPDAVEFGSFPPHCIRGTEEAEAVPELKALPFFGQMTIFEKNSIDASKNTGLDVWINAHAEVDRYVVVGDCTDLCVYQMAMHLRLDANARQLRRRVIVPVDCVDTYDLSIAAARGIGAIPHSADLLHRVFLYSMMLNGVEVVASLD